MASTIRVLDAVTGSDVSVEGLTNLNGSAVALQHAERMILAVRTAAATAVDLIGTAARGLLVEVSRITPATTAVLANVGVSTASQTMKTSNTSRRGLSIWNDAATTLVIAYAATASATSGTLPIGAGQVWFMDDPYSGTISGIWLTNDPTVGAGARITEIT
jgi:hypothetical protein